MNVQSHFNTIGFLLLSTAMLMAACSADTVDAFEASNPDGESQLHEYSVCADDATFQSERALASTDLVGAYVKTHELVCGVSGCTDVPNMVILYPGLQPSLSLNSDGSISNPDGPFDEFETWTFRPAEDTDVPNRLELVDGEAPDNTFQVSIFEVGPCRLRVENVQGWIEYTRLEEM